MNTKRNILVVIILIIILVLSLYLTKNKSSKENVGETNDIQTAAFLSYFCKEGELKVSYQEDKTTLHLLDGRTIFLPQVMSASGTHYENGSISFTTKGNNAFLEEDGKTTYNDCILGTDEKNISGNNTFVDGSKTFSFEHPGGWQVRGGELGFNNNWRTNTASNGLVLAVVDSPKSLQPQTNLSSLTFKVGTSSDPEAIKECLVATNGESTKGKKTINGVAFTAFGLGDAGAGNFYDTTSYRTMRDSQCYAIEYIIHSTNIGNYSPDQGIKQFDSASVEAQLENIVQSFKFL